MEKALQGKLAQAREVNLLLADEVKRQQLLLARQQEQQGKLKIEGQGQIEDQAQGTGPSAAAVESCEEEREEHLAQVAPIGSRIATMASPKSSLGFRYGSRTLKITHVDAGGPASREGTVLIGDKLLGVEDEAVDAANVESLLCCDQPAGKAVTLLLQDAYTGQHKRVRLTRELAAPAPTQAPTGGGADCAQDRRSWAAGDSAPVSMSSRSLFSVLFESSGVQYFGRQPPTATAAGLPMEDRRDSAGSSLTGHEQVPVDADDDEEASKNRPPSGAAGEDDNAEKMMVLLVSRAQKSASWPRPSLAEPGSSSPQVLACRPLRP